jgi:GT2 family glycosyltransferase
MGARRAADDALHARLGVGPVDGVGEASPLAATMHRKVERGRDERVQAGVGADPRSHADAGDAGRRRVLGEDRRGRGGHAATGSYADTPTVTIVFLVYNRASELRTSLREMRAADYPAAFVDVVVVDNASTDGAAEMVRDEFPNVTLIRREENCGTSGWNDGFAVARGDYVLALDDDCYLPAEGLRRALEAAREHEADLVSFGVASDAAPEYRFDVAYPTGLLNFWGCAVLMRREVVERLGGYDPAIFVWANELEFTIRALDHGFRHLYLPDVVAVHMKAPPDGSGYAGSRGYRLNLRHFAYIAAKLLHPRDAAAVVIAVVAKVLRDAAREDRSALTTLKDCAAGLRDGLRRRERLASRGVSRTYRENFIGFAGPWSLARHPRDLLRRGPKPPGRREEYYERRRRFYPETAATLRFDGGAPAD